MSVNEKVLDAIEMLAKGSVERAGYDKTIQAQILSCQDKEIGKYKCKFQDAIFYAYASSDMNLSKGSMVYILVPQNNMSKDKTIIGTVDKLGIDYVTVTEGEDAYEKITNLNSISSSNYPFYLDTSISNYSYDITQQVRIDNSALLNYINKSSALIIAATIQTLSPLKKGDENFNYGITFTLSFSDGNSLDYELNENNMIGNPYSLLSPTRQVAIFPIDGKNYNGIKEIIIHNSSDNSATLREDKLPMGDIIISNLEIYGANKLSQEQLNGIMLSLLTPQGSAFTDAKDNDDKSIIAQVKKRGNVISPEGIDFYWGRANMNVDSPQHSGYNQYLGYGWQLLNSGKINTYIVSKNNALADHNYFKVAAIYDGTLITRQIDIENLDQIHRTTIIITSSGGIEFFNNTGSPTLTCTPSVGYIHRWGWRNNGGSFGRADGVIGTVYGGTQLQNVQIAKINNHADFACTIEENGSYIGTGFITLTNQQNEKANALTILNGQAVFKYTEGGVAPTSQTLQNPQLIKELGFILRDVQGVEIYNTDKEDDLNSKFNSLFTPPNYVKWYIPNINTLLEDNNGGIDTQDDYKVYENSRTVSYKLKNSFDYSSTNNQIKLEIFYNGIYTQTQTRFMFTKQGDIGTNGTEYTVKIVPTTQARPQYPTVIKKGNSIYTNFNGDSTVSSIQFQAELWRSGQKIWTGATQSGIITKIQWFILSNKYPENLSDESDFSLSNVKGEFNFTDSLSSIRDNPTAQDIARANIIKCAITYENKIYYGTLPIITAYVNNSNSQISLKDNTGFIYAIYTTDGINPQYNRQPFEVIYKENNIQKTDYTYNFYAQGTTRIDSSNYRESNQLEYIEDNNLESYQHKYRPISKYNGQCVTNSILCIVKNNNNIVGKIRIPVHLFLNRFGHANLNAWDGNSIQIDDEGHYILAPQIGAGVKNSNNEFTGVVMGEVKEAGKNSSQIGLFGYAGGARSFFLDSNTGSATFGQAGNGQIVIDAQSAVITGGNYHFYDPNHPEIDGTGMQINLGSSPSIKFGNNNFIVHASGSLQAGYIKPSETSLEDWNFKVTDSGDVTLIGNLKAGKKVENNNIIYNFIVNNSAIIGQNPPDKLIQAGYNNNKYNFIVTADGDIQIEGDITANTGHIGGINGWTIGSDNNKGYICSPYNKTSLSSSNKGIYIGTDGISMYSSDNNKVFEVDLTQGTAYFNGSNITLNKDTSITWGNYTPTIENLIGNIVNGNSSSYITGTFIDGTTIKSPNIFGGKIYATGSGYNYGSESNDFGAYYLFDGEPSSMNKAYGFLSYDQHTYTGETDAQKRILLTTMRDAVLKFRSNGNMSLSTYGSDRTQVVTDSWVEIYDDYIEPYIIYLMSSTHFDRNIYLHPLRYEQQWIDWGTYSDPSSEFGYDYIGTYDLSGPSNQSSFIQNPRIGQLFFKLTGNKINGWEQAIPYIYTGTGQ